MSRSKAPKLCVYDPIEDSQAPFLRGILTRSLQQAGLHFDHAYKVASAVRDGLEGIAQITTKELTERVVAHLTKVGNTEIIERYKKKPQVVDYIRVYDRDHQLQPFSKGYLSQSLELCASSKERCFEISAAVEDYLKSSDQTELSSTELARITYKYLRENESSEAARRYLVSIEFSRSDRPLILLVGGTTGCGKSTISSELANRLNIVRTQSTDMLREVMRLMIPPRLSPVLHESTFNSWKVLPATEEHPVTLATHLVDGYLNQAEQVGVGIEGVLQRARRERVSLILEGVHINPAMQRRQMKKGDAFVVPVIIAALKRNHLRNRLKGRGQQISSRRSQRYLKHFDAIWQLQSYLLSEAENHQVPIIPNEDQEEAIRLIMDAIFDALSRVYTGDPRILIDPPAR